MKIRHNQILSIVLFFFLYIMNLHCSTENSDDTLPIDNTRVRSVDMYCGSENQHALYAFDNAINLANKGEIDKAIQLYLLTLQHDSLFCDAMDNLGIL